MEFLRSLEIQAEGPVLLYGIQNTCTVLAMIFIIMVHYLEDPVLKGGGYFFGIGNVEI